MPHATDTAGILAALLADAFDRWTERADLPDGSRVRAKVTPDDDGDPFDGFRMGFLVHPRGGETTRPPDVNGAARKFDTRDGPVWWQPPADIVGDATTLEHVADRVRSYFREEWGMVGLIVERDAAPCQCCGERKRDHLSLWGIESDATDYWPEVLRDLISELEG